MVTISACGSSETDQDLDTVSYIYSAGKYNRAYIQFNGGVSDVEIKRWGRVTALDEQIRLTLMDDTEITVSEVNCILYKGTLPKFIKE